jgi:hypothetical protein
MDKIYSRCQPETLLHMVFRRAEMVAGRLDLVAPEQFLQCSALNLRQGQTFQPHQHVWKRGPQSVIAQESWVVIAGEVRCLFYDLDGQFLEDHCLLPGDASFTLQGGHNYEALVPDTLVYEYKTGPYTGQQQDKVFI